MPDSCHRRMSIRRFLGVKSYAHGTHSAVESTRPPRYVNTFSLARPVEAAVPTSTATGDGGLLTVSVAGWASITSSPPAESLTRRLDVVAITRTTFPTERRSASDRSARRASDASCPLILITCSDQSINQPSSQRQFYRPSALRI